ncbi:unnamed protein product, partial [Rangifer tarandus platyrhynchus]
MAEEQRRGPAYRVPNAACTPSRKKKNYSDSLMIHDGQLFGLWTGKCVGFRSFSRYREQVPLMYRGRLHANRIRLT